MKRKTITTITVIAWSLVIGIIFFSCTPTKNNCGTKKQHKIRIKNTKTMAPSMMN